MNDDSTATFVSKFKVTVENGETAEFDSHVQHVSSLIERLRQNYSIILIIQQTLAHDDDMNAVNV